MSATLRLRALQVLAVLLPPAAALGALAGGQLQLFRGLALLAMLLALWQAWARRAVNRVQWGCLGLAGLVLLSAAVTWFWPGWPSSGLLELGSLVAGLALSAALAQEAQLWRFLAWGTVLTVLGESAVVAWEVSSGMHLPSFALTWEDDRFMGMWFQMAGTFANPNQLGHLVAVSFPVVVWVAAAEQKWWLKAPALAAAALSFWVVLETGSRLSLGVLLLGLVIVILALPRGWIWVGLAGLVTVAFLALNPDIPSGLLSGDKETLTDQDPRLNLAITGLWMLGQTWGLGVGPGNFGAWANAPGAPRDTYGLSNPHNAVIEVASQYGVAVAVAFTLALLLVLKWAVRAWSAAERTPDRLLAAAAIAGIALWPLSGMANSHWMPLSWSVMELGLLAALAWQLHPADAKRS